MKTLALFFALFAGSFGPSYALSAPIIPKHDAVEAYAYACKLMEYDCSNIPPPRIDWQSLYHIYGIFGGYNGDDAIAMDYEILKFADPVFVNSILAHEMTHYLDVQVGATQLPWTKEGVCDSEMRAWRVGNAYVMTHGRPELVNFEWFIYYGCFK